MTNMAKAIFYAAVASWACLLVAGCAPARPYDVEYKTQFASSGSERAQKFASGYFPESFGKPQVDCGGRQMRLIGEVEEEWFPKQWKAGREPSLYLSSGQKDHTNFSFRFSYIPSFDPSVFIRISRESDGFTLIAKEMSGAGGYNPGTIKRSKKLLLSPEQVFEIQRVLYRGFFEEAPATCELGLDGSEWIFELVDGRGYRMIKRWSPSRGAEFEFGQQLLRLTGWNVRIY